MAREFLMLAHNFKGEHIGGWYASEKLDGQRCFWDGGITRGMLKADVPWANTAKDERYRNTQYATGLWSRYGNPIQAPGWWLDKLPAIPCDGELWVDTYDKGGRQLLSSIIRKLEPDPIAWHDVMFMVFDSPVLECIFSNGVINTVNFKKVLSGIEVDKSKFEWCAPPMTCFEDIYNTLQERITENEVIQIHEQVKLPLVYSDAVEEAKTMLFEISKKGGEGVMVSESHFFVVSRTLSSPIET